MEMNSQSRTIHSGHNRHHSSGHRDESKIFSPAGRTHERVKSETHTSSSSINLPPPANDGEAHLCHYFSMLGLPLGSISAILKVYHSMESRIWIIENSHEMMKKDSHLMLTGVSLDSITREDGVSRWAELHQCVDFHIKMAARCKIPTKFWFVNKPHDDNIPQRFGICWGSSERWHAERDAASQIMKNYVAPEHACNPIASEVRKVASRLDHVAAHLEERDKFVSIIICTQGVPTDEQGMRGAAVLKDYLGSLVGLAATLPVKIVFRICNDDEKVMEFYNVVDQRVESDVLDDFWNEALEVFLVNPWLTYGIGIHRIREAGLGTELMDLLDEKPFTLEQIRQWCVEFFVGRSHVFLRHPTLDWDGFIEDINDLLQRERQIYNPVKNKLCDWIDVEKLNSMYQRHTRRKLHLKKHVSMSGVRKNNPFSASMKDQTSSHHGRYNHIAASMREPAGYKRTTYHGDTNSSPYSQTAPPDSPCRQNNVPDLRVTMKNWSHRTPNELRPLETLLVEVPLLFPPHNQAVEPHEYFAKWKEFSEDAFEGESGNELKELLKRAVRKAKFFLHPDKLPHDLTENQSLVLKYIWDVVQESELATFG